MENLSEEQLKEELSSILASTWICSECGVEVDPGIMSAVDHYDVCKRDAPNESISNHYEQMAQREMALRRVEITDRMYPLMNAVEQHELFTLNMIGTHIDNGDGSTTIMRGYAAWKRYEDYFDQLTQKYIFMKDYKQEEIQEALKKIEVMEHMEMARLWRFAPEGSEIYFDSSTPVHEAFKARFFAHFGGFTPEISKQIGWTK